MSFSRREFLMLGLSGVTGMAGGVISSSLKNLDFNDYKIDFKVNIFSNENKEEAKKGLSEDLEYLAEKGSYIELSAPRKYLSDEIKVYQSYSEINKNKNGDYIVERITGKRKFSLIVTSPLIGGTKEYANEYSFLDNNSILEIVNFGVIAELLDFGGLYKDYVRKFSYFDFDDDKSDFLEKHDKTLPPKNARFNLRDDNVSYNIYGLEALTDNDSEKLKREWLIKISALSKV